MGLPLHHSARGGGKDSSADFQIDTQPTPYGQTPTPKDANTTVDGRAEKTEQCNEACETVT
jgi:hypothetical protein